VYRRDHEGRVYRDVHEVFAIRTEMRFTKWGGRRHWRYVLEPLSEDPYGWWLGGRAGIPLRRGFETPVIQPHDFVVLVPPHGSWIANWNAPGPEIAVYVDVTTAVRREADAIHAVDLDLDVVRLHDGTVRVLDEDEFADHQVRYGYPPDVVARARATADDLVADLTAAVEPFGSVGPARLAAYIALG
jgi:hypothetical protein